MIAQPPSGWLRPVADNLPTPGSELIKHRASPVRSTAQPHINHRTWRTLRRLLAYRTGAVCYLIAWVLLSREGLLLSQAARLRSGGCRVRCPWLTRATTAMTIHSAAASAKVTVKKATPDIVRGARINVKAV